MEQLRFDAEHAGSEPEVQFIEKSLDLLEEIGDVTDPMPMSIEMRGRRNRRMAFDAYAYDEADGALVMIASNFVNEIDNTPTLTNTQIDDLYVAMRNFIDESVNGDISLYCDESDSAINMAKEIKSKIGKRIPVPSEYGIIYHGDSPTQRTYIKKAPNAASLFFKRLSATT